MSTDARVWELPTPTYGQKLRLETGRIATQADGAIWLSIGRTVMLVTAVSQLKPAAHLDFFPLTVEYRERMAAAGRVPGGFLRRETRPSNHEILGSRIIDRSIRPSFPKRYRNETQLLATVLSYEPGADTQVLGITAASAALMISDIPWAGPVVGVRVAAVDGELLAAPGAAERERATLDLVVTVSRKGLVMVEGSAEEVSEETLIAALAAAAEAAEPLLSLQERMRADLERPKRPTPEAPAHQETAALAAAGIRAGVERIFEGGNKQERRARERQLMDEVLETIGESAKDERETAEPLASTAEIVSDALRTEIRGRALMNQRLDGRRPDEVRPITGEVSPLPCAHGSSLFTRGETQAVVTCTLASSDSEQLVESLHGLHREAFLLHYNFPPYSVGEARPLRGPGRREVGHGWLARRALLPVLPPSENYPYTIRLDAEITSSNGSSSMAAVCGSSLALMDAGVPILRPVAGIAMGLIAKGSDFAILTDILGDEDHLGDMDFKIAGTSEGITAVQLDNKLGSLPPEILARALAQARDARLHILERMSEICAGPRDEAPLHAPKMFTRRINPSRIRDLIGAGGRTIQALQQETDVKLDVGQDGLVRIQAGPDAKLKEALRRIDFLTGEPRAGGLYRGRVTSVTDFGCFVELFQGIEGLVHVSELDAAHVEDPRQVAAAGDEMLVKVLGATQDGKIRLSRKAALNADPADVEN